jgi:predicted metal-dependent phosphoesterase TrpH
MTVKWNKSWAKFNIPETYKNYKGAFKGKVDMHIHSRFSDANPDITMDAIGQISKYCGFSAVSLTDHETYAGFKEFLGVCRKYEVPTIPGFELNVLVEGKHAIEVLAYGFDLESKELGSMLTNYRQLKFERFQLNVKRVNENIREYQLANRSSIDFSRIVEPGEKAVTDEFVKNYLLREKEGRNADMGDIVNFLLENKYFPEADLQGHTKAHYAYKFFSMVQSKGNEVDYLPINEAIKIIHQAKGHVFMAHDLGMVNSPKAVAKEMGVDPRELIVQLLRKHDIDGIEMIHSDFSAEEIEFNRELVRNMGLLASSGSDTHWKKPLKQVLVIGISPEKALNMQEWMKVKLA